MTADDLKDILNQTRQLPNLASSHFNGSGGCSALDGKRSAIRLLETLKANTAPE